VVHNLPVSQLAVWRSKGNTSKSEKTPDPYWVRQHLNFLLIPIRNKEPLCFPPWELNKQKLILTLLL
jgi:hypothetical protein